MVHPELQKAWERLLNSFGNLPQPKTAKGCDCPSCLSEGKILAMLGAPLGQLPEDDDARVYMQNALGTIAAEEDFTYLLPSLTRIWSEKLDDVDSMDGFREHFWYALNREEFFEKVLRPDLRKAASDFMRAALLARLGREGPLIRFKGQVGIHFWLEDVSGYARVAEEFPDFWREWWSMPGPGHAVAAVEFASCVAFKPENNPIFHKWTPLGGGGVPDLRATGGPWSIYWRQSNFDFIRSELTVAFLESSVSRAVNILHADQGGELAEATLAAIQTDQVEIKSRIGNLFED